MDTIRSIEILTDFVRITFEDPAGFVSVVILHKSNAKWLADFISSNHTA